MAINVLKSDRNHSIGVSFDSPKLDEIKEKVLGQVLKLEPILARGVMDHLIEYDQETVKAKWKVELLKEIKIGDLLMFKTLLENRKEQQVRRY